MCKKQANQTHRSNQKKESKLTRFFLKIFKPFSINKTNPIRFINPFLSKKHKLESLYTTIFLLNRLFNTNFKPIPHSKRLTKVEREHNKGMVNSILYELRLLIGSSTLVIIANIVYVALNELQEGFFQILILLYLLSILICILVITIKVINKHHRVVDKCKEEHKNNRLNKQLNDWEETNYSHSGTIVKNCTKPPKHPKHSRPQKRPNQKKKNPNPNHPQNEANTRKYYSKKTKQDDEHVNSIHPY